MQRMNSLFSFYRKAGKRSAEFSRAKFLEIARLDLALFNRCL
jgi:hypothetical protein